jgi:hypothetical protein
MPANLSGNLPRLSQGEKESSEGALDRVREALRGMRYGEVTVVVQDGLVIQVERTEKLRLPRR